MTLDELTQWGPWAWIVVGLFLAAAETLMPGAFLIWLGMAAIATGLVDMFYPLSWTWDFVIFPAFIFLFGFFGKKIYGSKPRLTDQPFLNRRADALVGREFVLDQPILNGAGRIRVDDTVWRVSGSDTPAGTKVRVTGATGGAVLKVERT
ncbi:MAG: NfeD family protein [Methylobacteriaceae bacterium]|nr:NfeD family protein [Methylobacteriaceae bacterium]MBV9221483.1 NfeD family protein [Methylobacteriaceae bacterium]MBV9246518.1 NfeD family protein [Methylobacteriaceae bacterium]MBV9635744.1 NfeD family protein [Methylobacteriaceae bacterium]MBV9701775.1 NfeD family protein [Methylobacteriaceae bacterium]